MAQASSSRLATATAPAAPAKPPEPASAPAPVKVAESAPVVEAPAKMEREPALVIRAVAGPVIESKIRFNDLMVAVLYRDAGAVNDLLAFGKWPDKTDSSGMTPLMVAAWTGETAIAQALLKAGADPRRRPRRGRRRSPSRASARTPRRCSGYFRAVSRLLQRGALCGGLLLPQPYIEPPATRRR